MRQLDTHTGYILRLCDKHAELWLGEEETRVLISTFSDPNYVPKTRRYNRRWISHCKSRKKFFKRITKEVDKIEYSKSHPIVITGSRLDLYLYRRINTYPFLIELIESKPGSSTIPYLDSLHKKSLWLFSHLNHYSSTNGVYGDKHFIV